MNGKAMNPLFIVFEGIDGCGKSTQAEMLYQFMLERKIKAVKLAEPSSGKWGKEIRKLLKGDIAPEPERQFKLFLLDREDDVEKNINPALKNGKCVIMDRYFFSNAAYQGAAGLSPGRILNENWKKGFPEPDRVYFLDLRPDTALQRIAAGREMENRDVFEKRPFLRKVRDIYLSIVEQRFLKIDASKSPDEVFAEIRADAEKLILKNSGV